MDTDMDVHVYRTNYGGLNIRYHGHFISIPTIDMHYVLMYAWYGMATTTPIPWSHSHPILSPLILNAFYYGDVPEAPTYMMIPVHNGYEFSVEFSPVYGCNDVDLANRWLRDVLDGHPRPYQIPPAHYPRVIDACAMAGVHARCIKI